MKNQKLLNLLQADAVDYYLRQGHSIETARYMATYSPYPATFLKVRQHTAETVESDWLAFEQGTPDCDLYDDPDLLL